jgi:hypothetical protein
VILDSMETTAAVRRIAGRRIGSGFLDWIGIPAILAAVAGAGSDV